MPIKNVKHGLNFKYIEPVNLYDCEFEENVFVGPFVEIQNNVKMDQAQECKVIHLFVHK